MTTKRLATTALLLAAVTAVAACGSSQSAADKAADQAASEAANPPTVTTESAAAVKVVKVTPGPGEGDLNKKPVIPRQRGAAPKTLIVQDLIVGTGPEAKSGDEVTVQYVGVLYANGEEFDSSWTAGKSFTFVLGAGNVIPGWDQGVAGMREGGRRRLIIPSDLAYGAAGSPPKIPANAALVFDVDLEKVKAG
ncbi:MAG: FKBP-type peptidylprolyl isomerase [Actinobacteria bacterium]|uniref:peptidylprolyl isomerase n=1 Tax=freshwater metagenome TaxID=449393 RepID=A0A6J5ZHB7_9ZZZZ|nr:FKBP-type peptidylprolyl isomerase [Actinomycetota bacterium]